MCSVSYIGDRWKDDFPGRYPWYPINPPPTFPYIPDQGGPVIITTTPQPTREEFEALKQEIQELKKLLEAAKKFDEKTGQPDCEMEEKIRFIKEIAKFVGVDLKDIFK